MSSSLQVLETELSRGDDLDLARASMAVALDHYPQLELGAYLERLDRLGETVAARSPESADVVDRVCALRAVLADEEGFRGNHESYDDPRNSFLNEVLDRKVGLPITLSIVYIEVARRAGIPLFGVSLPAHFCAAVRLAHGPMVVDAFDRGRLLDVQACRALLERVAPAVPFTAELIRPAAPRAILYRLLNNLKIHCVESGDAEEALRIVNLMLVVAPDHPAELRARASILSALGQFRAALADVNRCLALFPSAPDSRALEATAQTLRRKLSLLN